MIVPGVIVTPPLFGIAPVDCPHALPSRLQYVLPTRTCAAVAPFVLSLDGALAITSLRVCSVAIGPVVGSVNAPDRLAPGAPVLSLADLVLVRLAASFFNPRGLA